MNDKPLLASAATKPALALLSAALASYSLCSNASVVALGSATDASGKLTVTTFYEQASSAQQHWNNFAVTVPSGYVVIGGGVVGCNNPGNYLVASYPSSDLTTWYVSTKDQAQTDACQIQGYAIGLQIAGLTAAQVASYIFVATQQSSTSEYPNVGSNVPGNYILLGGGFNTNYGSGAGNIATALYPSGYPADGAAMIFDSKDQVYSDAVSATVYAIGILNSIPGVGYIQPIQYSQSFSSVSNVEYPTVSINLPYGFVLTGCGAYDQWSGAGNLLWELFPYIVSNSSQTCVAAGKDDTYVGYATQFTTYALGIQVTP
ncbi:MAG: hypothetical protein P4L83_16545 [Nevskia sp.]|nr:hypothetical protein [Nevskia sp.]